MVNLDMNIFFKEPDYQPPKLRIAFVKDTGHGGNPLFERSVTVRDMFANGWIPRKNGFKLMLLGIILGVLGTYAGQAI